MCDEKWIWYDKQWWPAQWLDREEAPKPNFYQRRSWLLFGGLLPVWSTIAFWIPVKPFHLRCMLSKLSRCNKSRNACSRHWSAEWLNSSLWQRPTTCHTIKVEQIGLQSFASSVIFTWPLTNQIPLLQASRQFFSEKTLPQPAGGRKCFPKVHWILKPGFLCYGNKPTCFSFEKLCWFS